MESNRIKDAERERERERERTAAIQDKPFSGS